jgi:endo-1,4-beta-xylanase
MGPAPPVYDVTIVPPLEGAGPTRTARWPWAVAIAAVVLLIPMGLTTGWLFLRYQALKAVPGASPERPTLPQGAFDETMRNPGFEAGLESWDWPGAWWTIATTTDKSHSGQEAAIVSDRTEAWHGIGQSILGRIEPGRVYYCSAWVRIENAPQALVTMTVSKVDDSKNGVIRHRFVGSRTVVENEWTEIHGTYVLDDMTGVIKSLFFSIAGPPPGVNLVVDDVSIKPLPDTIPSRPVRRKER